MKESVSDNTDKAIVVEESYFDEPTERLIISLTYNDGGNSIVKKNGSLQYLLIIKRSKFINGTLILKAQYRCMKASAAIQCISLI